MRGKRILMDWDVLETYDDTELLCYELTQRQAIMLLAHTEFLSWDTRYDNLPVTGVDLEEIMHRVNVQLIEGGACMALTDADKDIICEAVKCAAIDIGATLSAGLNTGLSFDIDDDGNLVVDDGSSSGLTGSSEEQLYGAATYVHERLLEFQQDYEDFFGVFPSSEANALEFFTAKYLLNATITDAITDYYAHRGLSNPAPLPVGSDLIDNLYCEGINGQTTTAFIVDNVVTDQLLLISMLGALSQDQYDQWVEIGKENPRVGYENTDCYRQPDIVATMDFSEYTTTNPGVPVFSQNALANHKWLLEVSGTLVDVDGKIYDGVFFNDAGTLTRSNIRLAQHFGSAYSPDNDAFYASGGTYRLFYDVALTANAVRFFTAFTPTSGELSFRLIDLGAI